MRRFIFILLCILFIFTSIAQTPIEDPTTLILNPLGTVIEPICGVEGGDLIGESGGITYRYVNTWQNEGSPCLLYGIDQTINSLVDANAIGPPSIACTGDNMDYVEYNAGLSDLPNGYLIYSGITDYQYMASGELSIQSRPTKLIITFTEVGTGNVIPAFTNGTKIYIRAYVDFDMHVFLTAMSPSNKDADYCTSTEANTFYGFIELFDRLNFNQDLHTCISFNGGSFYETTVTAYATNPGPFLLNTSSDLFGFGTGIGTLSYDWTGPNSFPNTQNPNIPITTLSDTGEYLLTVTDIYGCSAIDSTFINVYFDTDGDGVPDSDEIVGCQDLTACNYNSLATDSGDCIYSTDLDQCASCSGETNGTGIIVDNDEDDDGVCDNDEVVGCQDPTACNYNSLATDSGDGGDVSGCEACVAIGGFYCGDDPANWTSFAPEGCVVGEWLNDGYEDCLDASDENGAIPTADCGEDGGDCIYSTDLDQCALCSGETDGTGTIVDNDEDDDGLCDNDEVVGCQDPTACNYNLLATNIGDCIYSTDLDQCASCSGETDGTGTIVDNDEDDDGICDNDEVVGCQDPTACNFNSMATDSGDCIYSTDLDECASCSGETDGTGTIVDNDEDDDGICDNDEIIGCLDSTACNYNPEANQNDMSCLFPGDECDDNDVSTSNDIYNDVCECIGTPHSRVNEIEVLSVILYPNPASNNLTIDLGDLNGINTSIKLYDSSSKIIFDEQSTSTIVIDVSGFAKGIYSLKLSTDKQVLRNQVVIE